MQICLWFPVIPNVQIPLCLNKGNEHWHCRKCKKYPAVAYEVMHNLLSWNLCQNLRSYKQANDLNFLLFWSEHWYKNVHKYAVCENYSFLFIISNHMQLLPCGPDVRQNLELHMVSRSRMASSCAMPFWGHGMCSWAILGCHVVWLWMSSQRVWHA